MIPTLDIFCLKQFQASQDSECEMIKLNRVNIKKTNISMHCTSLIGTWNNGIGSRNENRSVLTIRKSIGFKIPGENG